MVANAMIGSRLPKWLKESIYRQSINHKVDNPLGVEVADAILRLRRTWMEAFCTRKGRHGEKVCEFVTSEIRDLPELKKELKLALGELRAERPNDVLGWICERARTGSTRSNGSENGRSRRPFQTLMFLWPLLKAAIQENPNGAGDRDRTGDIQLGKLAFYR